MRMRLVLVCLLLALSPQIVTAGDDDLPFLPRDGTIWAETPIGISWIPRPFAVWDQEDPQDPGLGLPTRLRPEIEGPSGAKVLAAIRAAFGRRVRIELSIAAPGQTLDLVAELPEGSVLREDSRETRAWPAAPDAHAKYACAASVSWRCGIAVEAAASRRVGNVWSLRLAVRAARAAGERRFEGDGPTLVVPGFEFATLVADVPVRIGEMRTIRADASLTLSYRVTIVADPAPPAGTRVYPLHALRSLVASEPAPAPGLLDLDVFAARSEPGEPEVPMVWKKSAGSAIRLTRVRPDIVIASGEETALANLDRVVAAWWKARGRDVMLERTRGEERTEIAVAGGGRVVLVSGRLRPVALVAKTRIAQSNARAALVPGWLFTGGRIVLDSLPDGAVRLEETRGRAGKIVRGEQVLTIRDQDGARRIRLPLDRVSVDVRESGGAYAVGEPTTEADGAERVVTQVRDWRIPR